MFQTTSGDTDFRVEFHVPARPTSVALCRRLCATVEDSAQLGRQDDLQVIVSELVTNSVRHGGLSADDRIVVSIHVAGDRMTGSVTDSGPGFADLASLGPRPDGTGGFGLYIVEQLADRWHVDEDDETCVTFELARLTRLHPVGV